LRPTSSGNAVTAKEAAVPKSAKKAEDAIAAVTGLSSEEILFRLDARRRQLLASEPKRRTIGTTLRRVLGAAGRGSSKGKLPVQGSAKSDKGRAAPSRAPRR